MKLRILASFLAVFASLDVAAAAQAQWNQFRGPGGQGIAASAESLPVEFDADTNVAWTCPVPPGHSSPAIWGERIFLTANEENELFTLAIDRTTGKELWRRAVEVEEHERHHSVNSPASPTPTTDGERVYVYFGVAGLLCYDFEGELVWRRELEKPNNTFGTASSPVLAKGRLVFLYDSNAESYLEAIDPENGKTLWRKDRQGFGSGWSTPVLRESGGTDELVVYGAWWVKAYDLADGSERWAVPGLTDEPCTMPVLGGELVYVTSYNMNSNPEVIGLPAFGDLLKEYDKDGDGGLSPEEAEANKSILSRNDADGEGDHPLSIFFRFLDANRDGQITENEWQKIIDWLNGYQHANALLAIRPGGEGRETEIVWQEPRGVPECPTPVYYEDRVYMVKNGGIFSCLDARTGELKYQERMGARGPRYSSPVVGDGKIYTASARGIVTVLKAGDSLEVLAHNEIGERIMATPAILGDTIYVRTEENLYAFALAD